METLSLLLYGLQIALSWENLLYCFAGCLLGTLVGVLPGIGPVTTVAILLPFTFGLGPAPALIMLAGLYYGAQYGGSTTAILVNIPGESSSVVTTIDGYQMARQGRAGPALGIAAIGSFVAGSFAVFVVAYFSPPLAEIALRFGPADYFSLMVMGLAASVILASGSLIKAIAMVLVGILLGSIGTDVNTGAIRFAAGLPQLTDGIGFIVLAMAFFGITDVLVNLEKSKEQHVANAEIKNVLPTMEDLRVSAPSIARGTLIGSILGILPGGGALLASFAAYMVEKKVARRPANFGSGDIRGVAAPESANNAGAQVSFIPMLTLGLPSNPTMALMIGALMIQGITPGPGVITERPELFWGLIASMWIGNLMLLVLNLPLVGLWVKLLSVPYSLLFPAILAFCCVGVYASSNEPADVYIVAVLAAVGYALIKFDCEPAPMVLGFVLGPMMEENLRRAMMISFGDPSVFVTRPISALCLAATLLGLIAIAIPSLRRRRDAAMQE